jgi:hypothetical protein
MEINIQDAMLCQSNCICYSNTAYKMHKLEQGLDY